MGGWKKTTRSSSSTTTCGGTMFNVTAKTCKQWADAVNNATYEDLLSEIATTARAGKYILNVKTLPPEFETRLTDAGFVVSKNTSRNGKHDSHVIVWG